MNTDVLVAIDLEMACWDDGRKPRTGEIIEVGVAAVNLRDNIIFKTSQYYVKPERDEISDFCTDLTGITQKRLDKQGRPLGEVLEVMREQYGWHSFYGAWGRDQHVIRKECDAKGLAMPFYEYHNLASLYIMMHGIKKKMSMKKAMAREGLTFEGQQHSGADDAYNLARLAMTFIRREASS